MRNVIAMLVVDDDKAIEKDLGTLDYLEKEVIKLSESGIGLQEARILDCDDENDKDAIELAEKIFNEDTVSDSRKVDLYQELVNWVCDHTENFGIDECVRALDNIGFTTEEIVDEINKFSEITLNEVKKIIGE